MAKKNKNPNKRRMALLWTLGVAIVIGVLIYFEQIPLLYVLATLALVALLLVVAFADLKDIKIKGVGDTAE